MLHLVEEICPRILILQKGRNVMEGTLDEIRAHLPELDADADLEEIFLRATGAGADDTGETAGQSEGSFGHSAGIDHPGGSGEAGEGNRNKGDAGT